MNLDNLGFFTSVSEPIWLMVEAFTMIGLFLYVIFAVVVLRQVSHMTTTLEVGFEGAIKTVAWLHLIFAIGTLVIAILIL